VEMVQILVEIVPIVVKIILIVVAIVLIMKEMENSSYYYENNIINSWYWETKY
jgi:hypothetical protein